MLFVVWMAIRAMRADAFASEADDSCWFSMYIHVSKTGGSFKMEQLEGFHPTRKVLIMRDDQLANLTGGPLPSPLQPENRRLEVIIHGDVHHDGCLQNNWTLPWGHRVKAEYELHGCSGLVWTLVRDPATQYISWFRWQNFGFRQRDMKEYLTSWTRPKRLKLWASTLFAKNGVQMTTEDHGYLGDIQDLVLSARARNLTVDWDNLSLRHRYAIFTVMLARPRPGQRPFAFQSMRLLPIWSRNSNRIKGVPGYKKGACPANVRPKSLDDAFVAQSLSKGFDLIGLTEVRAAVFVKVAQALNIHVPENSPLYLSDCKDKRDNPARDVVVSSADDDEDSNRANAAWTKDGLPSFIAKALPIVLADELRFYRLVRDSFWCKLYGIRDTVSKVLSACPHPEEFESYKCQPDHSSDIPF